MSGSWKANLTRSDDFEPFLLEVGVPWAIRKIAKRSTPVVAIAVTEKAFRQQASGPMGKKVDNGGEFGTVSTITARCAAFVSCCQAMSAEVIEITPLGPTAENCVCCKQPNVQVIASWLGAVNLPANAGGGLDEPWRSL